MAKGNNILRAAPVWFGSDTVWAWNGSGGSGFRFRRFLWGRVFFGAFHCKTLPTVPVTISVPGKTVPTVPVTISVPGPLLKIQKV